MGKTKREFIEELIQTAQNNVWKCELAVAFREANPSGDDKKDSMDKKAAEINAQKDKEYIKFLNAQLKD